MRNRLLICYTLSHRNFHVVFLYAVFDGNDAAVNRFSVYGHALNSLLYVRRILNAYVICCAPELTCDLKIAEVMRYARIYLQTLVSRIYSEDVLADVRECPCSGTRKP